LKQSKAEKETCIVEVIVEPESNVLPMLPPAGALNSFLSRRKDKKSIYDWYRRLPRTEGEKKDYKVEITEDDDVNVYFEE